MDDSSSLNSEIIKISNLSATYHDGAKVLDEINLEIKPAQRWALIGPNGAGKSSLLLCLMGFLPISGEIQLFGGKMTPATIGSLRRRMAIVFQNPDDQLFMPVLEDDVAFGPRNLGLSPEEVRVRVDGALEQVQMSSHRRKAPHHLSQGEKHRAALATALAMQADILMLDEPTSNLDAASTADVIDYLARYPGTLIVATHDLSLAKNLCTHCALLAGGTLVVAGSIDSILSNIDLLKKHRLITG
jgi:cobalt/nickel transport system ATP-binding protein